MVESDQLLRVFREARAAGEARPERKPKATPALEKRLREIFPILFATIEAINDEIGGPPSEVTFMLRARDIKMGKSPVSGVIGAVKDGKRLHLKVLTRGVGLLLEAPHAKPEQFTPQDDQSAADFLSRHLGAFFGE